MADPDLESVKSAIVGRCRHFWQERKKAYLLSRVGLDIPGIGQYIKSVTGKNLLSFLQTELVDALRCEQWSRAKNIWGIFPKDAVLTDDIDSYFDFPRAEPTEDRVPRYNPRFWAAFAKPLNPGERRFINLNDAVTFDDVLEESGPISGRLEIDPTLIPSTTEPNRDKVILENIQTWLRKFGVDGSRLLMKSRAALSQQQAETLQQGAARAEPRTELEYLIEAVGSHDLSRINLPLDVIARLLKKHRLP